MVAVVIILVAARVEAQMLPPPAIPPAPPDPEGPITGEVPCDPDDDVVDPDDPLAPPPRCVTVIANAYDRVLILKPGRRRRAWLFPVRSSDEAVSFFGTFRPRTLSRLVLEAWENQGMLYAEVVADNLGPVRLGIGSAIASTRDNETTQQTRIDEASVQRLVGGGGNLVLTAALPVLVNFDRQQPANIATVYVFPRLSADLPQMGGSAAGVRYNMDLGVEGYASYEGNQKKIAVFATARAAFAFGGRGFDSATQTSNGFVYAKVGFGLRVNGAYEISLGRVFALDDDVRAASGTAVVGVSLIGDASTPPSDAQSRAVQ